MREVSRALLEQAGYRVLTAGNGLEAAERFEGEVIRDKTADQSRHSEAKAAPEDASSA